jgi:hypothetical protein
MQLQLKSLGCKNIAMQIKLNVKKIKLTYINSFIIMSAVQPHLTEFSISRKTYGCKSVSHSLSHSEIGNWNLKLEFEIGNWNWKLELEIGIGNWNWKLELEIGIGSWNWKLEFEIGIGNRNWKSELEVGIGNRNWKLELEIGIGNWNWK